MVRKGNRILVSFYLFSRYDYIGKYESLEEDSNFILSSIGAPEYLKLPSRKSFTRNILPEYYFNLTAEQRIRLLQLYAEDIVLFGYSFSDIQSLLNI